jgi:hypothetical protein
MKAQTDGASMTNGSSSGLFLREAQGCGVDAEHPFVRPEPLC